MALNESSTLYRHLWDIHHTYRKTKDLDVKREYYSPDCRQICRPDPQYAAHDRDKIIGHLGEAANVVERIFKVAGYRDEGSGFAWNPQTSCYTARPLTEEEARDFGTLNHLIPAGFSSVEEIRKKANDENWAGLRINMWDDDGKGRGLLVKVRYWWRLDNADKDGGAWKQILHDILYMGPRDGTEEDGGGIRINDDAP